MVATDAAVCLSGVFGAVELTEVDNWADEDETMPTDEGVATAPGDTKARAVTVTAGTGSATDPRADPSADGMDAWPEQATRAAARGISRRRKPAVTPASARSPLLLLDCGKESVTERDHHRRQRLVVPHQSAGFADGDRLGVPLGGIGDLVGV